MVDAIEIVIDLGAQGAASEGVRRIAGQPFRRPVPHFHDPRARVWTVVAARAAHGLKRDDGRGWQASMILHRLADEPVAEIVQCGEAFHQSGEHMRRGTARLWTQAGRWVTQIEFDGTPYTERDYEDVASATQAIAQILRQRAERAEDLDQEACDLCDQPLDLATCSQCGVDAFVRTCEHGGSPPIRMVDGSAYCLACRP